MTAGGGLIRSAQIPTDVEMKMKEASSRPGPGDYVEPTTKKAGGYISDATPKSDVEWKLHFAKMQPGPGDYDHSSDIAKKVGGRISDAVVKSDTEGKSLEALKKHGHS